MRIPIYNTDLYAEVDEEDYEELSKHRWYYNKGGYAQRIEYRTILMHRQVLNILDSPDLVGDHINHDRLNNTRANLRACTSHENNLNRTRCIKPPKIRIERRGGFDKPREVFIVRGLTYKTLEEAQAAAKEIYDEAK